MKRKYSIAIERSEGEKMEQKLFDSELKIMEILWKEGDITAKEIAEITKAQVGWSKTTTYTVIKKCIDKNAIQRREPKFICHPMISRAEAQTFETTELINKMYDGKSDQLVASIIGKRKLSSKEIGNLKDLIKRMEEDVE